jgi:hypothetical protein
MHSAQERVSMGTVEDMMIQWIERILGISLIELLSTPRPIPKTATHHVRQAFAVSRYDPSLLRIRRRFYRIRRHL